MQTKRWLLPGLALLVVAAQAVLAAPPVTRGDGDSPGFQTLVPDLAGRIDVNEVDMFVTNQGSWAYDQGVGDAGLFWPKGSGRTAVFASGLWMGATINGETRVVVGEFSQEYAAGPMDDLGNPVDPQESDPQWRVLKIEAGDGPENDDWVEWQRLGQLLGDDGPPLDENGDPMLFGDQSLWCVYNDAVPDKHSNDAGQTDPLGVEVRQLTFAFNRTGALGKTVFLDFEVENKGSNVLENMYISLWFDPDLGGFTDDLVGSDTTLSLGFCYNATNTDAQYGAHPPAMGCDFFLGPTIDDGQGGTVTLGMASFNKYINGTDPQSAAESYNYMQGLQADGAPQTCLGEVTTYVLTGDPVADTGCLDTDPADRRFMMSTGPITMNPGDEQRIVAAVIIGGESGKGDRLSNVSLLKFYDLAAQDAFDRDFDVPAPPPQPQVTVAEADGQVILTWGSESQLDFDEEGYAFEGYNVYQGESAAGPYRRVATFDVVNGIAIISDDQFNPDAGGLENVIVQTGSDAGVAHEFVITQDFVRGGPLRNARTYHFAVTAYAYGADAVPGQKTLENRISTIQVVPQNLVSGVDLSAAQITDVVYTPIDALIPPPTNQLTVTVVDPTRVTGHRYQLEFVPAEPPFDVEIDGVTYPVSHTWQVRDLDLDQLVLQNQFNLTNNDDFDVFDGIQVKMLGVYFPQMQDAAYENNDATNRRALSWVNWGGRFFGGAADTGCRWAGSTIIGEEEELGDDFCPTATLDPDLFGTVELRFDGTQKGYRYLRLELGPDNSGAPANVGRGYFYQGYDDVRCTVWKVVGDTETQLQVMYTERGYADDDGNLLPEQPESQNALWDPTPDGVGDREYLQILDVEYSDTPDPQFEQDGIFFDGNQPLLYGAWLRQRADDDVIDPDDKFVFTWGNPADANDTWIIDTQSAVGIASGEVVGDFELARTRKDLERIRVVPNPYLTRSAYELDQFNRIMKFTNLPATCNVRIFTLAGDLIRTLEKDDASTSIIEWDLETRFGLPVGSGIYVYHVEAPGIGNTFGKFAVIMEKERLEDF